MNYIFVGEIVNTHGIKGELRIISNFKYKKEAFKINQTLYLGKRKQPMNINSYRVHKIYDMVTFDGINDINDAIIFKGDSVYVLREDLDIDGFLNEDVIGFEVYDENNLIGIVQSIMSSPHHDILVIIKDELKNLVPFIDEFVTKVDLEDKKIYIKPIKGLLNEN